MTREELAQDLSYVRTLAEEGRHAPLLGGSFLLFWGALNGAAYAVQWALVNDVIPDGDGQSFAILWIAYGIIAGIGSTLLGARVREKPGRSAIGVRAEGAIWMGVGIAISVVAIGNILRMAVDNDFQAPNAIMGAAFALFGAALAATSRMARETWLFGFALVSFAVALLLNVYANAPWAYLAGAIASVVVLATPGIILLRREPSMVV